MKTHDMHAYDRLSQQFTSGNPPRSMFPLLWLHGDPRETEVVLRREVKAMDDAGCGGFIIESRPHNDYLGERWWRDVDFCLDEARKRGMDVWMFDEEYYPSGIAGGRVLEAMPEYRMQVLTKDTVQWSSTEGKIDTVRFEFDEILKVLCTQAGSGHQVVLPDLQVLEAWSNERHTARTEPTAEPAAWTIHVIGVKPSWSGRMFEKMVDYLCPEVTDCFIEITYARTKQQFPDYWGTTLKGFFGDETSFENFGSYHMLFGEETPCFPWSRVLRDTFTKTKGYDLINCVESLWLDSGDQTAQVRFDFMDHITNLFSDNFFGRLQQWCHANGVQFIGHIIEDNHAHMHHGYGVGHFFRATKRFDMGGYDFVLRQFDSEQKQLSYKEHFPQFKHYRDPPYPDFFQYTLAKLAQSAAHLEVGTSLVMCENFGAYGWDLGLREMKWMTDWMTARGTNWYVPHAYSPIFPDPDCPPHFYACGNNPQWPYFRQWGDYANRSCLMLREANHVVSIAVLYPAESHWVGDQDVLDGVCKTLMQHQYDFDILSMDLLANVQRCVIDEGTLRIRNERFNTVVLPRIHSLPPYVLERLQAFIQSGGKVVSIDYAIMNAEVAPLEQLAHQLSLALAPGIETTKPFPELRFCHYRKNGLDIFFLNNESVLEEFEDLVSFPVNGVPERWTPMDGKIAKLPLFDRTQTQVRVPVRLAPYEAYFIIIRPEAEGAVHLTTKDLPQNDWHQVVRAADEVIHIVKPGAIRSVDGWTVTLISSPLEGMIVPAAETVPGLGNWHAFSGLENFSGSVVYEASLELAAAQLQYVLDLGEVGEIAAIEINGQQLPPCLCPPYRWELPTEFVNAQANHLRVTVTNTLGPNFTNDDFHRDVLAPSGLIGPVTLRAFERNIVRKVSGLQ